MKRVIPLLLLSLLCSGAFAQVFSPTYKVHGKVVNSQLEPLAFASIEVRQLKEGIITKEDGTFVIELQPGKYDLIVSMVGYMPSLVSITIEKDLEQNIILSDDESKALGEVVIRAKAKDRAEEVIRQVIDHKDKILSAPGEYSANVYIKATQIDSAYTKGKSRSEKDSIAAAPPVDLSRMAMAEIYLKLDHASPQQIKEERTG